MTTTPLAARYDQAGHLLAVEGDIEDSSVDDFELHLARLVSDGGGTVDLSAVGFLPSLGISAIVRYQRIARDTGKPFELMAEPGSIAHRVLHVMGML